MADRQTILGSSQRSRYNGCHPKSVQRRYLAKPGSSNPMAITPRLDSSNVWQGLQRQLSLEEDQYVVGSFIWEAVWSMPNHHLHSMMYNWRQLLWLCLTALFLFHWLIRLSKWDDGPQCLCRYCHAVDRIYIGFVFPCHTIWLFAQIHIETMISTMGDTLKNQFRLSKKPIKILRLRVVHDQSTVKWELLASTQNYLTALTPSWRTMLIHFQIIGAYLA